MKNRSLKILPLLMLLAASTAISQTISNQGTLIYIADKAVVSCFGTFNVNSAGMVIVEDSAKLTVTGTMNVSNGSLTMNKTSTTLVTQDLVVGGTCGAPTGTVLRNSPGLLHVNGSINNKGLVTNSSLIWVDKDLNNDGDLNNLPGSFFDIGP